MDLHDPSILGENVTPSFRTTGIRATLKRLFHKGKDRVKEPMPHKASESPPDDIFDLAKELFISPHHSKIKPFEYRALPLDRSSIRLLQLLVLESTPKMQCSILHDRLDNPQLPKYTTLSYAWGQTFADASHLTDRLSCDGGFLRITRTLHRALLSIIQERSENPIYLWVDALCINQADLAERSEQVKLMPSIYSRCADMIVWLGELNMATEGRLHSKRSLLRSLFRAQPPRSNSHSSELALASSLEDTSANSFGMHYSQVYPSTAERAQQQKIDKQEERQAYVDLTQRAWFHRKWVVQEMAQTSRKHRVFLIGPYQMSFTRLESAIREFSLEDVTTPVRATVSNKNLLQNLLSYHNTQCSDPLDHIYSLLGLSEDGDHFSLDYTCEVDALYRKVARHYFSRWNGLEVIMLATAQKSAGSLPSWVPDWRQPWQCDRSPLHAETMATLAARGRKLFTHNIGFEDTGSTTILKDPDGLEMMAWIVPQCFPDVAHTSENCTKCRLLKQSPDAFRQLSKQPAGDPHRPLEKSAMSSLASRQRTAWRKWSRVISEQFETTMQSQEVLCLFRGCAVGFVLKRVVDLDLSDGLQSFRLEFCFQVDEEGWLTNWFADLLSENERQWIRIK